MGGSDFTTHGLALGPTKPEVRRQIERAAAVHIADRIAAEHPERTAAQLAADPHIANRLRETLAQLGLNKEQP